MYEWKLEISAMYCPFAEIRNNLRHCNINHEPCTEENCKNVDKEGKTYTYGGVKVEN
jgi:hypothetical protein